MTQRAQDDQHPGAQEPVEVVGYVDRSEEMLRDPEAYFERARLRARQQIKAERRAPGRLART